MLRFLQSRRGPARRAFGPAGSRAFAVGDVHGCLDQLRALLSQIDADIRARGPVDKTFIVFLGDLVDRGPDSRGVVELLMRYAPPGARPIFLMGNHEEFVVRVLDGEVDTVGNWLTFGGRECANSYGLSDGWLLNATNEAVAREMIASVPAAHRDFLNGFSDSFRFGDYLLVHAGIRPGVAIDEQRSSDLRWIREGFLDDRTDHGVIVVHGHTIVPSPEEHANRIAIDTGAYKGGALTALGLEGGERWFLSAT